MLTNKKISVIMPHINEGFMLNITLDSFYLNVKYDNYEIIIIDDGSDDIKDLNFINAHPLKDKIKVYYKGGLGVSNARNYGSKIANGEILMFIDSHMYIFDDILTKVNELYNNNSNIDILQPIIRSIKNKQLYGTIHKIKDYSLSCAWDNNKYENSDGLIQNPCTIGCCFIVKKSTFKYLDGFNINYIKWGSEDLEFSMRGWLSGFKNYYSEKIQICHYFKTSFENTVVLSENVLHNKIMFAITCFSEKRQKKIYENLINHYGKEMFDNVYKKIENNINYQKWNQEMQNKFVHNDDWYFEKFSKYYEVFL